MEKKISFLKYLHNHDPNFLKEGWREFMPSKKDLIRSIPLTAAILGGNYIAGDPLRSWLKNSSEEIRPEEILLKKTVIPKDLIKNSQINPSKWDRDFENLEDPGEKDIGFATHKDYFSKPVELYVLDDKAIKKISPTSIAFTEKNRVFLSSKLFEILPNKNSDGKLNSMGVAALTHELRHTTQSMSPLNRKQNNNAYVGWYQQYMQDPQEMGVRVAAIKNMMDKSTIQSILNNIEKNDLKKQAVMNTIPEDEEVLFMYFFEPDIWADKIAQEYMKLNNFNANYRNYYRELIESIKKQLALKNEDVRTLFDYYETLTKKRKRSYLQELLGVYKQVVQNTPSNKKLV